jgi:phage terminase large subunit
VLRDALIRTDEELKDAGKPYSTETEFDGYVWDEKANEKANSKKDELPVDKDNHGMDAMRYMVAFMDSLADDPEDVDELMVYDDEVLISPY